MIDIDFTLFIQIINFLVLVFIMNRFLFKPILNVIEKRSKKVNDLKSEASGLEKSFSKFEADLNIRLEDARSEAAAVIDAARKDAITESEKVIAGAEKTFEERLESAKCEIVDESKKASEALKNQADLFAKKLASKILSRKID